MDTPLLTGIAILTQRLDLLGAGRRAHVYSEVRLLNALPVDSRLEACGHLLRCHDGEAVDRSHFIDA